MKIPGGSRVWARYEQFRDDLPLLCETKSLKPSELTFTDYSQLVTGWQKQNVW